MDRLLAKNAFGERWGRHWLDVARYADSNGLDENTAFANAWRYRDWVVRAFNDDLPYDDFARMQIAGDLLHGEAVIRQVGVEGANHPVPPGPDGSSPIGFVSPRVGIPSQVQPDPSPAFPERRRFEEPVHESLKGVFTLVVDECIDRLEGRRKPEEIQGCTTRQQRTRGLLGGLEILPPMVFRDVSIEVAPRA